MGDDKSLREMLTTFSVVTSFRKRCELKFIQTNADIYENLLANTENKIQNKAVKTSFFWLKPTSCIKNAFDKNFLVRFIKIIHKAKEFCFWFGENKS